MQRFLIIAFWLLSVTIISSASLGAISAQIGITSSSETELTFSARFNQRGSLPTNLAASTAFLPLPSTITPIDDSTSLEAAVVCFLIPQRATAHLTLAALTPGTTSGNLPVSLLLPDSLLQVRLARPVLVRGLLFGKAIIPLRVGQGGDWYDVAAAEITIRFEGGDISRFPNASGWLDNTIIDLAINSDLAGNWRAKAAIPAQAETYNPFSQSSNWARVAVKSRGVYKINRTDLIAAGVSASAIDPQTLRLFHNGGKPLPAVNSVARDSLAEVAIAVSGEEDGTFSGDDFIMFYANGADFWDWSDSVSYRRHPYSDRNVFYLTYGGSFPQTPKRMALVAPEPTPTSDTLHGFVDRLHFEDENILAGVGEIEDYFHWYWSTDTSVAIFLNLPDLPETVNHDFRVKATAGAVTTTVSGSQLSSDSTRGLYHYFHSDRLGAGLNSVVLHLEPTHDYRKLSITDFVEVGYHRRLVLPAAEPLIFSATGNEGQKSYAVTGSMASPYLIDITDLRNQRIISLSVSAASLKFTLESTPASGREFALVNASAMAKPFSIVATQIDDIRSAANAADLIIVTHDNFYSQAVDFAAYRQSHDGIRVRVVKVSDVYAQFSGGMVDPIAIRDFLRYAFDNWSGAKPSFCLLAGDGVYDFRNNLRTNAVSYIPPFIVENDSTISDENYCYFGQLFDLDSDNSDPADRGVDMVIARWPVKTAAEFNTVAEKIKRYDTGSNAGPWRNLITLIADDQNHPESGPETGHTIDSETLARWSIPGKFDLNKIYGIEYPYGSAGEKPEMREAIVRSMNSGTLLVNYIGHGNPNVWADEHVFRRLQDIPRLTNSDRLPLIFNASCSIGFFDDPVSEGMAEDFLRYAGGGAVGTVSATRQVFSRPNADFNQQAFTQLFGGKNYTIAEAVFVAKLLRQGSGGTDDNDRKYIYIGDPLTRLAVAPLKIDFATFQPDSFVALMVTRLSGEVKDQNDQLQSGFNGNVTVSVYDNERTRHFQFSPYVGVDYQQYGPEIYRGKVDVTNGLFDLRFVVPKDISYGGRKARVSSYAVSGSSGAAGFIAPIAIGSINKAVNDTLGPDIAAYFSEDPGKSDHAEVPQNAVLTVELFDSLGINLSGDIGHSIELVIDDNRDFTYTLTDSFTYNSGSYQRGKARMSLPSLTPGDHLLKTKAWDSANNSSQREIAFRVTSATGLEISGLLCYPNPVAKECQFTYVLSDDAADVTLKIFTLSGIEILSLGNLPETPGYHSDVRWDLRDADGDIIANGVYLFQLSAHAGGDDGTTNDGGRTVATGKLVVMK